MPGAAHCADMPHTFGLIEPESAEDRRVEALLQDYTYNFIAAGDPNGPHLPPWTPAVPGTAAPLYIGTATAVQRGFKQAELAYWYAKWRSDTGLGVEP